MELPSMTDFQDDDYETPPGDTVENAVRSDTNAEDVVVPANLARARGSRVGRQGPDRPQHSDLILAS